MNNQEIILENLKGMAKMIRDNFGSRCEVAVHDLRDLEHSLTYIAGELTGRKIGAPITDLVVKELQKKNGTPKDLIGYRTVGKDGRILRSSTAFIRDKNGKVFATLCVNYDITDFLNFTALLQDFTKPDQIHNEEEKQETFAKTVHETIDSLVNQSIVKMGKQPAMMSMEEKVSFVGMLEERGAFMIKGSVDYIAAILSVSKFTVYNYQRKFRAMPKLNSYEGGSLIEKR
ncbi:helix-turn-helix transcriptional regulator [Desulfitobacterium sp. AusDCA]|uniref:helix-turn-helix transcriptional regulator n=1 Tax=Desulfitobacterium sp. AusDCA TaxID=3240383 RepID=UPI003DA7939B